MSTTRYVVDIEDADRLILPFEELIRACGRSAIRVTPCKCCGKTILCGDVCVICAPVEGIKEKVTTVINHEPI
jgi:hypothetical protein